MRGDILLSISDMEVGTSVLIFSMRENLYLKNNVEIYELIKEQEGIYIRNEKIISFDKTIEFKEKVMNFKVSPQSMDSFNKMGLTKSEKNMMQLNNKENNYIREEYDLCGVFENGIEFNYPCIIEVR